MPNNNSKKNHDSCYGSKLREFKVGDDVHIRNFRGTPLWIPGVIVKYRCPVSYCVKLNNGIVVRRHVDHVKSRKSTVDNFDITERGFLR